MKLGIYKYLSLEKKITRNLFQLPDFWPIKNLKESFLELFWPQIQIFSKKSKKKKKKERKGTLSHLSNKDMHHQATASSESSRTHHFPFILAIIPSHHFWNLFTGYLWTSASNLKSCFTYTKFPIIWLTPVYFSSCVKVYVLARERLRSALDTTHLKTPLTHKTVGTDHLAVLTLNSGTNSLYPSAALLQSTLSNAHSKQTSSDSSQPTFFLITLLFLVSPCIVVFVSLYFKIILVYV